MAAINCYKVNDVSAWEFDGTQVLAEALVAAYPAIISIQTEESIATGDAVLAVIDQEGEVLNCYADQVILFTTDIDRWEQETVSATDIISAANFAKYYVVKGVPN